MTDIREALRLVLDNVGNDCQASSEGWKSDELEAALELVESTLAEPIPSRPASFEFAMGFLGDPEASELRQYIDAIEARLRATLPLP